MKHILRKSPLSLGVVIGLCSLFIGAAVLGFTSYANAQSQTPVSGERLITIHDQGQDRGILTRATTLRDALNEANIPIDPNDLIEPGLDETLVATNYDANIYRARPVTVIDGAIRQRVMSAYQTPKQIAQHAGIVMQDEDEATLEANTDIVSEGTGMRMTISRATPLTLVLYGKTATVYTREKTVAALLKAKNITVGNEDTLSVSQDAPIQAGMKIELWRNGKQTVTEEQDVAFKVEEVKDADQPVGYHQVKTPGIVGKKMVTYEIEMRNGQQVDRKEIQNVVTKEPVKQIEVIGAKPSGNGLTKAKGTFSYRDSKGIVHRETYYDLPMSKVMAACGGGSYTVRGDGAKVDKDGYILIAANLSRYPRCSIVETSLGLGKVYDTGGFASRYPDGFDLATDWSNYDGS